jgi:hypothetical protein
MPARWGGRTENTNTVVAGPFCPCCIRRRHKFVATTGKDAYKAAYFMMLAFAGILFLFILPCFISAFSPSLLRIFKSWPFNAPFPF